jgi:hypothetical protein
VFGELDTVALAAHCGSNDGFVSVWYDQSGNSNDATQTVAGDMPKIYDGTTGVLTEGSAGNEKPIIQNVYNFTHMNLNLNPQNDYKLFTVMSRGSISGTRALFRSDGGGYLYAAESGGTWNPNSSFTLDAQRKDGATYNPANVGDIYTDFSNQSLLYLDFNGAASGTSLLTGYTPAGYEMFGHQEIILYPDTSTHTITDIEDNINTFYNIY